MTEIWRQIKDFPSYFVSDRGRVLSKKSQKERFLKVTSRAGYPKVAIQKPGIRRDVNVHTLVLETFVGPCPQGMQASHIDGNKRNAKLSNLKWETISENNLRKRSHGTQQVGEANLASKLTQNDVQEIRKAKEIGASTNELSKKFKISRQGIWRVTTKRLWKSA